MGLQENKAVYKRFIEEVFNKADFSNLRQFLTDDYQIREAPPGTPPGADGVRAVVSMFRGAFPDLQITLDEVIAEGDAVCARSTMRGTHRGPFMGFQATGKNVAMSTLTLVHIRDGRLCDSMVKNDVQALMKQLGAEPVAAR